MKYWTSLWERGKFWFDCRRWSVVVGMLSLYQVVIFYLQYQTQIQCQSLSIIATITIRSPRGGSNSISFLFAVNVFLTLDIDWWLEMRGERKEERWITQYWKIVFSDCSWRRRWSPPTHLNYVSSQSSNDGLCFLSHGCGINQTSCWWYFPKQSGLYD